MNIRNKVNKVAFFLFLVSAFFQSCKTENNQKLNLSAEKEKLIERVEDFNTAFKDGEIEELEAMITNNYLHTNSSSKSIRKNEWFSYLKKRKKELTSGNLTVNNYEMSETEVEIYNDMAIVTAKISFSTIKSDEQKENEFRITTIWVNDEGIWKRAGFHDTRIK